MICKLNFGNSFGGCLDYITGKYDQDKQTKILAHSMGIPDMDNKSIAQIFRAYSQKGNHDIKCPVGHFAYSFHKNDADRMTDEFMTKIVKEHMQMLGIKDTEWILGRHYDTDHEHAHLMFSMVDRNGNVIDDSMIYERNKRICNYLNKKYGLTMTSEKDKVNRNKLRGKEKVKYDFYDRVMKCKQQSSSWIEFNKALRTEGLKLRFHYNNVTGKLMGVAFTDGKYSFSGKQLDEELKLESLVKAFGDFNKERDKAARVWYQGFQQSNPFVEVNGEKVPLPKFDEIYPNPKLPKYKYPSIHDMLSTMTEASKQDIAEEHTPSVDISTEFISLYVLLLLLVQPYHQEVSMGGGPSNNHGWRDKDDDEKERENNQGIISKPASNKPAYRPRKK